MFTKPHEFFMGTLQQLRAQYGGTLRIHLGTRANVAITTPEGFEKILSSSRQITKGKDYKEAVKYLIAAKELNRLWLAYTPLEPLELHFICRHKNDPNQ